MPVTLTSSEQEFAKLLQSYLQKVKRVPAITKDANEVENRGYFQPFQGPGGKGKVVIGRDGDGTTLVHELTHAADVGMAFQFQDLPPYQHRSGLTGLDKKINDFLFGGKVAAADQEGMRNPAQEQFYQGYQKLARDQPAVLAKRMDKDWTKQQEGYRSSPLELKGHAVGNMVGTRDSKDKDLAPLHIDSTIATEFQIMLDLAQRAIFGDK